MKFTVERARWVVAEDGSLRGNSALLSGDGYMCCLGFVCAQLGVPAAALQNRTMPWELEGTAYSSEVRGACGPVLADFAANINDAGDSTRSQKEEKLKELFAEYGHTIEFVEGE